MIQELTNLNILIQLRTLLQTSHNHKSKLKKGASGHVIDYEGVDHQLNKFDNSIIIICEFELPNFKNFKAFLH